MAENPIQFYRTRVEGRIPDPANMQEGELALNMFAGKEKIFFKNSNNEIAAFISEKEISAALAALLELTNAKLNKDRFDGMTTVTTLVSIPINKRLVMANVSTNESISLASAPLMGEEVHIIINNNGGSTISIALPNTGMYVLTGSTDIINILPGKYGEVNIVSDGNKLYIRGL